MKQHGRVSLQGVALLLALFCFGTIGGFALAGDVVLAAATLPPEDHSPTLTPPQAGVTPVTTEVITLPLVEHNSGERILTPVVEPYVLQETPLPEEPQPTPTITPTPLPPQTGLTNLPIVIGASAIFLIIIFAWLLVGLRPRSPSNL